MGLKSKRRVYVVLQDTRFKTSIHVLWAPDDEDRWSWVNYDAISNDFIRYTLSPLLGKILSDDGRKRKWASISRNMRSWLKCDCLSTLMISEGGIKCKWSASTLR